MILKIHIFYVLDFGWLGGNYLSSLAGSKPNGAECEASESANPASQNNKKESEVPMTAAAATETALSVVAQWEEEKVIQPVGQDYVEELRGGDGNSFILCNYRLT